MDATLTTDEARLLATIKARPDDDLPRLVLADWLDEHGDAVRAELIRVQVDCSTAVHTRMPPYEDGSVRKDCRYGCRACILARRATELLVDGWQGWAAGFGDYCGNLRETTPYLIKPGTDGVTYARGFIDSVTCPAAAWLAHGDAVTARHPVRHVALTTWPEGEVTRSARQRNWRSPPRLGGHILDCWRAEWPGITFELPPPRTSTSGDGGARSVGPADLPWLLHVERVGVSAYSAGRLGGEMEVEVSRGGAGRVDLGATFGPLTARTPGGAAYRVERATVVDARQDMNTGRLHYRAAVTGAVTPTR